MGDELQMRFAMVWKGSGMGILMAQFMLSTWNRLLLPSSVFLGQDIRSMWTRETHVTTSGTSDTLSIPILSGTPTGPDLMLILMLIFIVNPLTVYHTGV